MSISNIVDRRAGWDELVQELAGTLSSKIGVRATDSVEASLQHVVLLDSNNCYKFSTHCNADPGEFGKLVVMPMSPTQVRVTPNCSCEWQAISRHAFW